MQMWTLVEEDGEPPSLIFYFLFPPFCVARFLHDLLRLWKTLTYLVYLDLLAL